MQTDASKRLSALAVAEILPDIRKNRCVKELCVIPLPCRRCKKTVDAGHRLYYGHQTFLLSIVFDAQVGRRSPDGAQTESYEPP
jgi:hypothetical protein